MENSSQERQPDLSGDRKISAKRLVQNIVLLSLSLFSVAIGFLSFKAPDILSQLPENPVIWMSFLIAFGTSLALIYRVYASSRKIDVVEADRDVFVTPTGLSVTLSNGRKHTLMPDQAYLQMKRREAESLENGELPPISNLDTPFEMYVNNIVRALDSRINISERKAAVLLEQGKNYIFGGIVFNVMTIAIWHVVEHNYGFSYFLLAGIASTSLTFLVIEFLAAWFLKQYRSYVDTSMSYLRVRSVFNRYLLIYYSVNQFSAEDSLRDVMVSVLSEDVKWPSHNDLASNDFNYMLEAMGSFANIAEKLKAIVKGGEGSGGSRN